MKRIALLIFVLCVSFGFELTHAQSNKSDTKKVKSSPKVEVYYFHFTARCYTCRNVEAKAKESLQSLYGEKVSFQSINLDDPSSKALAEKFQVYGQTLLITKGDAKINLTNEGFMYANTNPDKFKAIIKEKVDQLMQ